MSTPLDGLARMRRTAVEGGLDALCDEHGIAVLTVFGSAGRGEPTARDLDVAVLLHQGRRPDYPALVGDLQRAAGTDIDLAVLNGAGPVLRERALVGVVALYEAQPGGWVRAATAAALERMDTAWMRRLDLELLAG